ncbi:MAG: PAS domain-containing protein [Actinomycetota bacterium]|nr:PAS domain-containing protein [Actinomycetota bacterium]
MAKLAAHIDAGEPCTVVLLNYRKDGTTFWNELNINPVFDDVGRLMHFVGVQTDVSERVRADIDRDRAHAAERTAPATSQPGGGGHRDPGLHPRRP